MLVIYHIYRPVLQPNVYVNTLYIATIINICIISKSSSILLNNQIAVNNGIQISIFLTLRSNITEITYNNYIKEAQYKFKCLGIKLLIENM